MTTEGQRCGHQEIMVYATDPAIERFVLETRAPANSVICFKTNLDLRWYQDHRICHIMTRVLSGAVFVLGWLPASNDMQA